MARLITKFKYLKPKARQSVGGYAKYIAIREGVDKVDDTFKLEPSTKKQQQFIEKILRDFPDSKEMLEYEDYREKPTVGNASEFISRALEDNAHEVMQSKTYADYIATRPGAQRFGTHGLFTDDGVPVKLGEVSDELNHYGGNVWTVIISLRREDAERLGYNTGERWRDMLRSQTESLSENFHIPLRNLKWYAAFHNESHHPHVHLMVYGAEEKQAYLSRQGVMNLRSAFAKDIFAQDLLCTYEKQTEQRDALRRQSRKTVAEIIARINSGTYDNPRLEALLLQLADRLSKTGGKKQYGYLKQDVKSIVNRIVEELSMDERIAALYDLWYTQKEEVLRIYTQELPKRQPLGDNPEFKSVKNVVIREAMNIASNHMFVEDQEEESLSLDEPEIETDEVPALDEPTEQDAGYTLHGNSGWKKKKTWWTEEYKLARKYLYGANDTPPDLIKAFTMMQAEAEKENGFAMHDLGKMYLSGLGCEKEEDQAQAWFTKAYHAFVSEEAVAKKKDYLQYRIGKLFSFGYGVEQDDAKAASWYEKAVAENNPFAAYALGSSYRKGRGVEADNEKAYSLYRMAADHTEKPNAYAAYELGRMCKDGLGTVSDKAASDNWYRRAYQGFLSLEQSMADDKLYYRLGQMNLAGTGTNCNVLRAKQYFEKAVALDNIDALYGLGKLYLKKDAEDYDPQKAVSCLIEAAKHGHDYAQYTLGRLYLRGEDVPKNISYAMRWLEEAVTKENQHAEYLLGKTLLTGADVEQDLLRAERLLQRSMDKGNRQAMYTLGKAYLDGVLPQNLPQALHLLAQAADTGFDAAQYLMGRLLFKGEVVPQDLKRSISYLEQAAAQGNPYAAYLAGKLRLTENEVRDIAKAIRNFEIAAENGNDYAEYQLGKLYLFGQGVEHDYEKAITYLTQAATHGNQYAAQLLLSIKANRSWAAMLGTLRLLQHLGRLIQNRLENERKGRAGAIDRKLRRRIDEKKQAQGLRQG